MPPTHPSSLSAATRKGMQTNSIRESRIELRLRQHLWHLGARGFRKDVRSLPGRPDLVFGRHRVVVFLHGCFWHGCTQCGRFRLPKTNVEYWQAKLDASRTRHSLVEDQLIRLGYSVMVIWECEINRDLNECATRVLDELGSRVPVSDSLLRGSTADSSDSPALLNLIDALG
jgi:DNA mismatch endonuclease (patch repair protein)